MRTIEASELEQEWLRLHMRKVPGSHSFPCLLSHDPLIQAQTHLPPWTLLTLTPLSPTTTAPTVDSTRLIDNRPHRPSPTRDRHAFLPCNGCFPNRSWPDWQDHRRYVECIQNLRVRLILTSRRYGRTPTFGNHR